MAECSFIDKLRGPKILDMSIFDWIASLLGAAIVGYLLKFDNPLKWIVFIIAWVCFGTLVHFIFGVPTMFGYYLGLNKKPLRNSKC
ncbi:MAG: hypothetical protein EBY22_17725 [Gammaproteobacteria bacterium]|nr:hypothetical protein [Gammaproteobacteria bacterium]